MLQGLALRQLTLAASFAWGAAVQQTVGRYTHLADAGGRGAGLALAEDDACAREGGANSCGYLLQHGAATAGGRGGTPGGPTPRSEASALVGRSVAPKEEQRRPPAPGAQRAAPSWARPWSVLSLADWAPLPQRLPAQDPGPPPAPRWRGAAWALSGAMAGLQDSVEPHAGNLVGKRSPPALEEVARVRNEVADARVMEASILEEDANLHREDTRLRVEDNDLRSQNMELRHQLAGALASEAPEGRTLAICIAAGSLGVLLVCGLVIFEAYHIIRQQKDTDGHGNVDLNDGGHGVAALLHSQLFWNLTILIFVALGGFAFLWWQHIIQPFLKQLLVYIYLMSVILGLVLVMVYDVWEDISNKQQKIKEVIDQLRSNFEHGVDEIEEEFDYVAHLCGAIGPSTKKKDELAPGTKKKEQTGCC